MKDITRGMQNAAPAIDENFKELLASVTSSSTGLTLGGGNTGQAVVYRQGKKATVYFFNLLGRGSGGNDSVILTIPEGFRTVTKFEHLVSSMDRSVLNSATISFETNGQVIWRRNSSYASIYFFVVNYHIA